MQPSRTKQHIIDSQAQNYIAGVFVNWALQPLSPDYGEDFRLIVFNDGVNTGLSPVLQLKGTECPKWNSDYTLISFSLEVKRLLEFEGSKTPTFLIVVDVIQKEGYWIFIQEYIDKSLQEKEWRSQTTTTVVLPEANRIEEIPGFQKAIEAAWQYLATKYPISIEASISAEKNRLEKLDPRFAIHISINDSQINHFLQPKENVELQLHLKFTSDEISRKKLADLIGRGVEIEVNPGEAAIKGSPIFETQDMSIAKIHFSRNIPANLAWIIRDSKNTEITRIDRFIGKISGGTEELRYDGEIAGGIFKISLKIPLDKTESLKFTATANIQLWQGQQVRYLSGFDDIQKLFHYDSDKYSASLVITIPGIKGNIPLDFDLTTMRGDFYDMQRAVLYINKCRFIAEKLNIDPIIKIPFTIKDMENADTIYALLKGDIIKKSAAGFKLKVPVVSDQIPENGAVAPANLIGILSLPFLSGNLDLSGYRIDVDIVRFVGSKSELERKLSRGESNVFIELAGDEKAIMSESLIISESQAKYTE